jgi:hypothetical protein
LLPNKKRQLKKGVIFDVSGYVGSSILWLTSMYE